MEPHRTPEQVLASAAAMDRARAADLPDYALATLLAARDAWWGQGQWPDPTDLAQVLREPAARTVDAVLIQAIRNHLASLR